MLIVHQNRWFMTLQNQLPFEELNPGNKALFDNSCTAVHDKQKENKNEN